MSVEEKLFETFFEGFEYYATAQNNGTNVFYKPVNEKPTVELVKRHLEGHICLGCYQLSRESMVSWVSWDVDSSDLKVAKGIARDISEHLNGIPHAIEYSGSKGYHIFIFFKEPVEASRAKIVAEAIRDGVGAAKRGDPHVEVYPKQEKLSDSNMYGNLLKLPLGLHPGTHNRSAFVDRTNGWESGPEIPPLEVLGNTVEFDEFQKLMREVDPWGKIVSLITPYWAHSERHNLSLAFAGLLAGADWTEQDAEDIVTEICEQAGDRELDNRLEAVKDTFKRFAAGKSVIGLQGLGEILPQNTLKELFQLVGNLATSETLLLIDRIRLEKTPQFQKVRSVSNLITSTLRNTGRVIKNTTEVMWLEEESRVLYTLETLPWEVAAHKRFGINNQEGFFKQVSESIRMSCLDFGEHIKVHKRSFWDGNTLRLNLGGVEVYKLDGDTIEVESNGDGGVIFKNYEGNLDLPNLLQTRSSSVDPWDYLVNDISFARTENVSAAPEEQLELLKAWILSTFFGEAMPTRPILMCLGAAGSGKTTTARRILRVLEGPQEDVLGLVTDKPDSLRTSIMNHKIVVLDNLEKTRAVWLLDMLNRISTGTHIELRKLYKTNEMMKLVPDAFIIATAIEIPFSEESLFSRILPVEMDRLQAPKPEYFIQHELQKNFLRIWLGMLEYLNSCVKSLKNNKTFESPTTSRLADFSSFCKRIEDSEAVNGQLLMAGIHSLSNRQQQVLTESSPFVEALSVWIAERPEEAKRSKTIAELNTILENVALRKKLEWRWNTSQGLSRHIQVLEPHLARMFGMAIEEVYDSSKGRKYNKYRFEIPKIASEERISGV